MNAIDNDSSTAPNELTQAKAQARALLQFIAASPTPWHAVANAVDVLQAHGFVRLREADSWQLQSGGRYFVTREDAALLAFTVGSDTTGHGFRIIGAHTDSPCLRVKAQGAHAASGLLRLCTELYGSPILATFSDRDLLLAGRVMVRDTSAPDAMRAVLVRLDNALVRLPNLAIHLNRNVNDEGLKLHKHSGLNLLLGLSENEDQASRDFRALLAGQLQLAPEQILSAELCAVDAQPGSFFGIDEQFISARALDNLASCHAALQALTTVSDPAFSQGFTQVIGLFDHEEVGSESISGAAGNFLESVLQRIADADGTMNGALPRACARSWHMSADMAHAHHPAHTECFDGQHQLNVNGGIVLKMNASQRYATNASGEAFCTQLCERAQVPMQKYIHRADLACGTTIGPIAAARLGIRTFDIGCAMWAMHSARESCGSLDQARYIRVMQAFLSA